MRLLWTLCLTAAAVADTVSYGPWTLEYGPGGPLVLRHGDRVVSTAATFTAFQPEWKGAIFGLAGAEVHLAEEPAQVVVAWRRDAGAAGRVEVSLRLTATEAQWSAKAEVVGEGPCEFGIYFPVALVQRDDGSAVYYADDQLIEVEAPYPDSYATDTTRFETPETSLEWRFAATNGRWLLQDRRRADGEPLRFIIVAHGGAQGPFELSATLRATRWEGDEVEARRQYYGQRTRWVAPVEFENAGFEAGAEGWSVPPNGAVVAEGAHTGQRCARLTVADPHSDAVYITRQVPIVGGSRYRAECFVRTAGVEAKPGRMASVGAGLIVEWADRDAKWLASGEYACELYGDHDWTPRACDRLRAPEDAGYAVIFLALRGAGTAWFDDIRLVRIHAALALQSPRPGASLADNTPELAWHGDPAAESMTVQLSRDPGFPAEGTIEQTVDDSRWSPAEPIAPGTWYWRVLAPGFEPSAVWSFDQTAPVDRDTTAPALSGLLHRVISPEAAVTVRVVEAGPPPTCRAQLGDQEWEVAVAGEELEVHAPGGWPEGLNDVTLTVEDAAGNRTQGLLRVLYRPMPAEPVRITADGAYESGGHRIFPFGLYQVSPAAMPRVKAGGFDVVHVYQWESSQDDSGAAAYLDAAAAAGLRVFIGFDRGTWSKKGLVQGNRELVVRRVSALCSHPGLFCWYLFDEPEVADQYVPARLLIEYANIIRTLDPYHPVVVTTWGPRMALYQPSFDTHWTQAYTTPDGILRTFADHRRQLGERFPITFLAHCYDRDQHRSPAPDPARFQPDAAWLRGAAYTGVTQNINGLWWWFYNDTDPRNEWLTVADVPWAWEALCAVLAELKDLEAVLTAPGWGETSYRDFEGGRLAIWRKTVAGETTVVAVSTSEAEATVEVPLGGDGEAEVLFENRRVERREGVVTERFGRYGVHVYRCRE